MMVLARRAAPYFAFLILATAIVLVSTGAGTSWADVVIDCIDNCVMMATAHSSDTIPIHRAD